MPDDLRARSQNVDIAVQHSFWAKLGPFVLPALRVILLAEQTLGRASGGWPDRAGLRRTVERHLAFSASLPAYATAPLAALPISVLGGLALLSDGKWIDALILWALGAVCAMAFLFGLAWRIRRLMKLLQRGGDPLRPPVDHRTGIRTSV
jgi:hypothetical protein